ncbi:obscurin isoform X1 [Cryptotermes secundus]|uniref:obscurin isoform X1 n=1 Tax=Cryptotermes secundus TaxID=105785 RepID=UPI001454D950|nr:obscurin isoform X1 [Cryptotermes secundus]
MVLFSRDADTSLLLSPKETNIVAHKDEKAVLPCLSTSSSVNITLFTGVYYWSMKRVYLGKQPHRNQTVTYDPKLGFILDPVTEEDTNFFRCKGTNRRQSYNSMLPYSEMEMGLGDSELIKFTLDVNTGHLLAAPNSRTIIVKEGSEAVLPCKPHTSEANVTLYREHFNFEVVKLGRHRKYERHGEDDDDDYYDDDHNDDEVRILSYDYKKGFNFSTVYFSDDATYKCEAKSQDQKEVMYFYMHIEEVHLLRGTQVHHIYFFKDDNVTLPCMPSNHNVSLTLYHSATREVGINHSAAREIPVESTECCNLTVTYDPNVGYTLKHASMSNAGTYRCEAKLRAHEEYEFFYVHFNSKRLLKQIDNRHIYPNGSGHAVIPCTTDTPDVKVKLYREIAPGLSRLVQRRMMYGGETVEYNHTVGYTVHYSVNTESVHFVCTAELGQDHDSLDFYWHGESLEESLLLRTASNIILANEDDKAVVPCRSHDADTEVQLFIGRSYLKRRKIQMGQQPHRNQIVTYDPMVGFTLDPVSHLDSSWYKCIATLSSQRQDMDFYLEVHEPPSITETNLSVDKNLVANFGSNMTMFCKSKGMPYPDTFWFKQDGIPVVTDASYELGGRNQSLIIKLVQPEHEGMFSCLVENELGTEQAEGNLTISEIPPRVTRTNLNASQNIELNDNLTIFCKSKGKPETKTVWFKDGKPVVTDANVELGERNQTLTINAVNLEHSGMYQCKVWNSLGEAYAEGNVTVSGMEPARITDTNLNVSQDLEVKLGETLTMVCRSQGNPEPKTHWLKDGNPVDSDSTMKLSHRNQELNIAEVKMEHRGTYCCVVDNGLKKVQVEGTVTINEPAKIIETNLNVSQDIAAEVGTNLTMFCKSEGNPPPQITWFKDGKPLDKDSTFELKDSNQTLVIKGVRQEMKGLYRCVVHNKLGEMQIRQVVNVTGDSTNSARVITVIVVFTLVVVMLVGATVIYIRSDGVFSTLRQYMKLNKPEECIEEPSEFSERLEEEYFRSASVHREMNDYSNLIVSECLPEVSRPALQFLDDEERNAQSVGKSDGVSIIPPCASAVRSLEMKTI